MTSKRPKKTKAVQVGEYMHPTIGVPVRVFTTPQVIDNSPYDLIPARSTDIPYYSHEEGEKQSFFHLGERIYEENR